MKTLIVCSPRTAVVLAVELARSMPMRQFELVVHYLQIADKKAIESVKNLKYIEKTALAVCNIPNYDALITFGCSAHRAHRLGFFFSSLFKHLGKPRFEVQHGLLQQGLNLDLPGAELENYVATDHQIAWQDYGVPVPMNRDHRPSKIIGIMSNLHWHIYSERERSLFYRSIIEVSRRFPEYKIVWRHHPGELSPPANRPLLGPVLWSETNLYSNTAVESETQTVNEFLRDVAILIATPSTVILEAQLFKIPTIVFGSSALSDTLKKFPALITARKPAEFIDLVNKILSKEIAAHVDTGITLGFNGQAFNKLLSERLSHEHEQEKPHWEYCMSYALSIGPSLGVSIQ